MKPEELDMIKREAAKWLKVLEEMTATTFDEKKSLRDIAEALDEEVRGLIRAPTWWDRHAKDVGKNAVHPEAIPYHAACAAARMCCDGEWEKVKDSTIHALILAGIKVPRKP